MNGQGLFAYAVFSVTEKCVITNTDVKIELRMWEGKPEPVTGGSLNNIKSEKITNQITTRVSQFYLHHANIFPSMDHQLSTIAVKICIKN